MVKGASETIKIKAKEQECRFLNMIFDTLGATLLGNTLAGKGVFNQRGTVFLIPYHLLTNFEMQRYHKSKSKCNVVLFQTQFI